MKHSWVLLAMSLYMVPVFLGEDLVCYQSGNCYTILTKPLSFTDAIAACGSKGTLTTMKNEQEAREISHLLSKLQYKPDLDVFWIGLTRINKCLENTKILYGYSWVSGGEDSEVNYWAETPKKSCVKKRCVGLQKLNGLLHLEAENHTWVWKDSKCSNSYAAICRSPSPLNFSTLQVSETGRLSHAFVGHHVPDSLSEMSNITVLCGGFEGNLTLTCGIENGSYSCISTQCSCIGVNEGYERRCVIYEGLSCVQQCLSSGNFSCHCPDEQSLCDRPGAKCLFDISSSSTSPTSRSVEGYERSTATVEQASSEESWIDTLLIPLILGLVALGILVMLVWGGIQMCVRKKKPPRKKSIAPVVEPEGSDTDSTDHSSSDEEEAQERIEMP